MTTLFLITLPVECERVNRQHPDIPKSVALGIFVAIAGVTQLVSPLVGRLSDSYVPPVPHELGQRLPYLVLGSVATVTGLLGELLVLCLFFLSRGSKNLFTRKSFSSCYNRSPSSVFVSSSTRTNDGVGGRVLGALQFCLLFAHDWM